jgi:Zn-dependent protease with chaperone function
VLAHEAAHHDLGHLRHAEVWAATTAAHAPLRFAAMMLQGLARRMYSRDAELAADAHAIEICRKAGYELKRCLEAFDILTWYLLNNRDLDGVYGADEELELDPRLAANPIDWAYIETRLWLARHRRPYPAIVERRRLLTSQIATLDATTAAHTTH